MIDQYRLRVSSSIINFRDKAEKTWNIKRYEWSQDIFKPAVFFGMYHIGDYMHFVRHLGPKSILWAGSDITSLINAKLPYYKLFRKADNYCENEIERKELDMYGIRARVVPSFLEDVNDFPVSYRHREKIHIYISCHSGREEEYGVELVKRVSQFTDNVYYNIYGTDYKGMDGENILFHGRVSPEQFNYEIKDFHVALRCNEHDGFSEVLAKGILMGQVCISKIKYPFIASYKNETDLVKLLNSVKYIKEPNIKVREYYKSIINKYPWVQK